MITIKLPINPTDEEKQFIKSLQKQQTSLVGVALKCINKNDLSQKELTQKLNSLNNISIDSWFKQSAIYKAKELNEKANVIFGGKQNWLKYIQKKITKEEFKANTLFPLYSVGDKLSKGNRKFSIDLLNNIVMFKLNKDTHISLQLPKLRNNYKKRLIELEELSRNKKIPFTVKLTSNYIAISYEERPIEQIIGSNILALDLNPNFIGFSVQDQNYKILKTELFDISKLTDSNKQNYELSIISNKIIDLCKRFNCGFVGIEDIKIKAKDHQKGKNFNKAVNNKWNRTLLIKQIERKCKLYGVKVFKVNPAYSSVIGNLIHTDYCDAVAASLEIGRRCIDVCVKKIKNGFYPEMPDVNVLSNRWKEAIEWSYGSWKELFLILKNSKFRYRISLSTDKVFKNFQSHKSLVMCCDGVMRNLSYSEIFN